MLKLERVVIVEGKYDKIKLSNIIDAPIIQTDGFGIFNNKELQKLIRTLAEKKGLLILTDSDSAGFKIRNFINSIVPNNLIINAYIPDIYGKEKRKDSFSKEGKLGVEGIDENIIIETLKKSGILCDKSTVKSKMITKSDFYEFGLTGKSDSKNKRKIVLDYYGLPERLTTNSLITVLNCITSYDEFLEVITEEEIVNV